ncbi:hypothetical protein KCP71_00090 [Salmonella enterica subsp. enterica]|nr:hypothetical protein KCP71_00090 [Salmonella enterica subsp. enterica]
MALVGPPPMVWLYIPLCVAAPGSPRRRVCVTGCRLRPTMIGESRDHAFLKSTSTSWPTSRWDLRIIPEALARPWVADAYPAELFSPTAVAIPAKTSAAFTRPY